jgi:hypothetical protein
MMSGSLQAIEQDSKQTQGRHRNGIASHFLGTGIEALLGAAMRTTLQ